MSPRWSLVCSAIVLVAALPAGCRVPFSGAGKAAKSAVHSADHLPPPFPGRHLPGDPSSPIPSPGGRGRAPGAAPGHAATATGDLIAEGARSSEARTVICLAYDNFYDPATNSFTVPTEAELLEAVRDEISIDESKYVREAESLYELLTDPRTDIAEAAAALGCA
jgi:predicted small secreted protein